MAISVDKVKDIQAQTIDLGELILSINPVTDKEWDAFSKLVDAHKNLMKIDTDALLQLPLPFTEKHSKEAKPRPDCPRCGGKGEWADPAAPLGPFHPCICKDVDDTAWEHIKGEWEEALKPAEV